MRIMGVAVGLAMLGIALPAAAAVSIDLGSYARIGRYALPNPTNAPAPPNSLLAQEASGITYNRDTDTLFVIGDGGTSIAQVTKTGQLVDSMTLAPGSSPQGTAFYDPEGIAYVGGGRFVFTEERDRIADLVTYVPGTTIDRTGAQSVKLGTTIGNVGLEGLTYDPLTGGFIFAKEQSPQGLFQTNIDFAAGTATNGSSTTVNSVNLFDPALLGLADIADVYALANVPGIDAADAADLLVLSQESGLLLKTDRQGNILGRLDLRSIVDANEPNSVADKQFEGVTADAAGNIYLTTENGGGGIDFPQLFVLSSAVPEPATWATMLCGFAVAGAALRSRRRVGVATC